MSLRLLKDKRETLLDEFNALEPLINENFWAGISIPANLIQEIQNLLYYLISI